jgi:hypothetical protein
MAKKKETVSIYDVVQGLSQAAANAYDGALTEDGEPLKVGLQREEGDMILDKRIMDGFGVSFVGDMMNLTYQSDVQLKEVYASGFEREIDQRLTDISNWLKKECKRITGKSVTLTVEGEVDVRVESSSRVRSWILAKKIYKVGGFDKEMRVDPESKDLLETSWKTFLDLGGWKGKRPKNDTRPKGETK